MEEMDCVAACWGACVFPCMLGCLSDRQAVHRYDVCVCVFVVGVGVVVCP